MMLYLVFWPNISILEIKLRVNILEIKFPIAN